MDVREKTAGLDYEAEYNRLKEEMAFHRCRANENGNSRRKAARTFPGHSA